MKDLRTFDHHRIEVPSVMAAMGVNPLDYDRERNGIFVIPYGNVHLCVIVSIGRGWEHISVLTETRCPTWEEMSYVAQLFFKEDEVAMQLHDPRSDHINNHLPFVLHWWRPNALKKIPLPPKVLL